MFGQLRKAVGRSYVRGRAPNLNRLSSVRENAINPHPQPSSVFAQFPVVCMFNWMLGRLRKDVGRSCLEGVCSWKRSESESAEQREGKEIKSRSQLNSVFARFLVVCMFNWMLGRLRKAVKRSCLKGVCSWKRSEFESAEQREGKEIKPRSQPNSVFARFSVVCMFNWMLGQLRKGCGKVVS